ncbi:fam-a protein [Plasmodium chabaudi chabaudi]|uniref:Fam-a protein n=1 Tax=Plasmodium chabaudi chabaudi TaxID=31271 RepID=A0A077TGA9_PLACU|nr:fam-a protein [Plasmodium chabaudi chabaudi]SCL82896.1 fam-a protein [Plasmodium chabaudi chabaudi]VTZ66323.1 fam-a protein [Plasmodium chabaudi chabaudi]|eukprot:XP_016653038.1 fam-a protein [Plasmodium chabaudi chabaudi]
MNKGYMKTVFVVLSLVVCAINNVRGADTAPITSNTPNIIDQRKAALEAKREELKRMTCDDPEEIQAATSLANENVSLLLKIADNMDGFELFHKYGEYCELYYKKFEHIEIKRFNSKMIGHHQYNSTVDTIWDYANLQKLDRRFIIGNPVRIYTPNLVLFEKFNIDQVTSSRKKRFALGAKAHISDDVTVILCPTRVLKYDTDFRGNIDMKEMLERAEPINDDADPEETLLNLNANVSGFIIRKIEGDQVDITYLNAIFKDDRRSDYIEDRRHGRAAVSGIIHLSYWGGEDRNASPSIRSLTKL